jgi:hypothetical protein
MIWYWFCVLVMAIPSTSALLIADLPGNLTIALGFAIGGWSAMLALISHQLVSLGSH